jgi:streptogramin lyase
MRERASWFLDRETASWKRGLTKTLRIVLIIIIIAVASAAVTFFYNQESNTNSNACPNSPPTPYISEYCVINQSSSPNAITVDSKGNVWFISQEYGDLGVLYSSNSSMHVFHVPIPGTQKGVQSWGIAVDNSRNLVWFSDYADNGIWSFSIPTQHFTYYNVTYSAFSFPYQVALDSKGNVWFTEAFANAIGELTTTGRQITYALPAQLAKIRPGPFGVTLDRNGTVWFTDPDANAIGSLSINTGSNNSYSFQVYNMTGIATQPVGIALDPQGNVWFTQHGSSLISEFKPKTHLFRSITTSVPTHLPGSLPYFIYLDSNGNAWFNEHYGNMIGEFMPSNSSLVEYNIPTMIASAGNISGAITMNLSPNNTPWFTEWYAGKIGKVNLQVPLNIGISFQNSSANAGAPLNLSQSHNLTLALNVVSPSDETVNLTVFLSSFNSSKPYLFSSSNDPNKTAPAFVYNFSDSGGKGNFSSLLTIQDQHIGPGTYYITISEVTTNIHFSKVIQVQVS